MSGPRNQAYGLLAATLGVGALMTMTAGGGCVAIADIGDIEFGPSVGGAGGTSSSSGTGGTSTSSGTGGGGGSGGAPHSCDDNEQNGSETGIDCGGPDCPECAEDCTNGEDDDGNNLVDCEDSLCAGYHCVPEIPSGWSGPAALYLGDSGNNVPACDVAWPTETSADSGQMTVPAADCGACSCDPPTGSTCGMPGFWVWANPSCPGAAGASLVLAGEDMCTSYSGNSNDSVRAGVIPIVGGSCAASSGTPTFDPPSFAEQALLCDGATLGAGCAETGQVCVRRPQSPFGTTVCVSQAGDLACPSQDYTEKHLLVVSLTEGRTCSACSCDPPAGATCSGTTTAYTNQSCTQDAAVVPNDGTSCVNQPTSRSAMITNLSGPVGGSCASAGGQPGGTVTVDEAMTVCCLPE